MSRPATESDLDASMAEDDAPQTTSVADGASAAVAAPKKKKKKAKKKKSAAAAAGDDDDSDMAPTKTAGQAEAEAWLSGLSEEAILRPGLLDPSSLASLRAEFHAAAPFKHICLRSLLDASFARTLQNELKGLDYFLKSSDLFEFAQSADLKSVHSPLVDKIKEILYGKRFRKMLSDITDIELGELQHSVDMSANVYGDTNTLLCHDDELSGRRIAYILYLVPEDWSEKDGGSLDLFDTDADGQPRRIVKRLVPEWNSFTFFEVSPVSYHQVSEVLTNDTDPVTGENRVRISISGWYHGKPITRPPPFIEPPQQCKPLLDNEQTLEEWLAPEYRKPRIIAQAARQFQEESSIELTSFLAKDKYKRLTQYLEEIKEEDWEEVGPANKRHFSKWKPNSAASSSSAAASSSASEFLSSLHSFFQSRAFGDFLHSITGLHYTAATGLVRRFQAGCYTLAHSEDDERLQEAVDVTFCCLKPPAAGIAGKKARWDPDEMGGSVHYIEEGNEEQLLAVPPAANTLALVYRSGVDLEERASGTGGVVKFVKYINHRAKQNRFDMDYVFRVDTNEDDGEDEEEDSEEEEEEEEEEPEPVAPKKKQKKGGK